MKCIFRMFFFHWVEKLARIRSLPFYKYASAGYSILDSYNTCRIFAERLPVGYELHV